MALVQVLLMRCSQQYKWTQLQLLCTIEKQRCSKMFILLRTLLKLTLFILMDSTDELILDFDEDLHRLVELWRTSVWSEFVKFPFYTGMKRINKKNFCRFKLIERANVGIQTVVVLFFFYFNQVSITLRKDHWPHSFWAPHWIHCPLFGMMCIKYISLNVVDRLITAHGIPVRSLSVNEIHFSPHLVVSLID